MKSFAFLCRHPPPPADQVDEAFDLALTAAAFGQSVQLVLIDDAVWRATPSAVEQWDAADIDHIWVERDSWVERGRDLTALPPGLHWFDRTQLTDLFAAIDIVVPL